MFWLTRIMSGVVASDVRTFRLGFSRLPGFPALESHSIAVPLQTLVARLLIIVEVRALG